MIWFPYYTRIKTILPREDTMKLTVFGASGGTGSTFTGQALAAGHDIIAVVRDPARPGSPSGRTSA
jgi:hypothetical protein